MKTFACLILVLCLIACGSEVDGERDQGGSAGSGGSGGTGGSGGAGAAGVCTPNSTMECVCHQGGTIGETTCFADGSGWGPCAGACQCPTGRSDGCCPGDGICCSCISCGDPFVQDPAVDAFIECVCQPDVCGDGACSNECAGMGIGADCAPCSDAAATGACSAVSQVCVGG